MTSPWLDVAGAAAYADCSESTILRALRRGELKGYKVSGRKAWRVRREAIDAWIMGGESSPKNDTTPGESSPKQTRYNGPLAADPGERVG